ncbi:MAG: FecR family protein [Ginsengibacter sp.]
MLSREKFIMLLGKYTSDNLSSEERIELFDCITSGMYDGQLLQDIENNLRNKNIEGNYLLPQKSAEILHKILNSEKQNSLLITKPAAKIKLLRWAIAAAVMVGIIFSVFFFKKTDNTGSVSNFTTANNLDEKINSSAKPLKIVMEDGSIITLEPGAVIHYPANFLDDKREIFLEGGAFFEVSKNPDRPFFVYNKNVVTRVLGTSFNIKINKENRQVEVSVRTGRVEVYENKSTGKTIPAKKDNGVILLPNQKVIYDQATRHFFSSLVDHPLPLTIGPLNKKNRPESFVFEEVRLKNILPSFEKTYGIDIVVENENIYNCLFTGDVSQQDLYTRLNIICQSVGATYEVEGTKILIKGSGCN